MKIITQLLLFILISFSILSQEKPVPIEITKYGLDFSKIWMNPTYQGIIGNENQRIQVKFISIEKDNTASNVYLVKGKSIVHNNVCDFFGVIQIKDIRLVEDQSGKYLYSIAKGTYRFKEDPTQSHVGEFEGKFRTKFVVEDNEAIAFNGEFSNEGTSVFMGQWSEYDSFDYKICNWGRQIPPQGENKLFQVCDPGKYSLNIEYLDKMWESYLVANRNTFINLPPELKNKYSEKEIEEFEMIEKQEWWK